jgi:hypothetical protein
MIWNQCPGETLGLAIDQNPPESLNKKLPVGVIIKYFSPRDSPYNDVMFGARRVYAGFTWHCVSIADEDSIKQLVE